MGEWQVIFRSSEKTLKDVLLKTGSLLIRPRFINELKAIAKTHRVNFKVRSPEGINKLPSSFVIVEVENPDNSLPPITGLFEYAYGAVRLVAVDDEAILNRSGDEMIEFFEKPAKKITRANVIVYESRPVS